MIKRIHQKILNENKKRLNRKYLTLNKQKYDKFSRKYKDYKNIKLHFGCGPRVLKGWINIDLAFEPFEKYLKNYTDKFYPESIRGNKNDFYAIDVTRIGIPLPDNSVNVIFHEDFLEHLNQKDQIIFLTETLRVLKKESIHRINTPNLLNSMKENSNFSKGKIGIYEREWNKHRHLNVLTPKILEEMAKMIGYSKISFNKRDKSISKEIPLEYRPGDDRKESGNIFADLIK